jgi:hypothetical protein
MAAPDGKRFAAMMGVSAVVAGGIVFGMANGAIAASFSVSGQQFKVSATKLEGKGFAQFGGFDTTATGTNIADGGLRHQVGLAL